MTASWIVVLFAIVGILSTFACSRNRLIRSNISALSALVVTILPFLISIHGVTPGETAVDFFTAWTTKNINYFPKEFFDRELVKSLFVLALFTLSYALVRLVLHFTVVGINPDAPLFAKEKWTYALNLMLHLVLTTSGAIFLGLLSVDLLKIPFGFLDTILKPIYQEII